MWIVSVHYMSPKFKSLWLANNHHFFHQHGFFSDTCKTLNIFVQFFGRLNIYFYFFSNHFLFVFSLSLPLPSINNGLTLRLQTLSLWLWHTSIEVKHQKWHLFEWYWVNMHNLLWLFQIKLIFAIFVEISKMATKRSKMDTKPSISHACFLVLVIDTWKFCWSNRPSPYKEREFYIKLYLIFICKYLFIIIFLKN